MKLHILAIGVHPDDIELGCSGTLINHIRKGQKAGILDLTAGELGSRGTPESRQAEASAAAKVMGVAVRDNLHMRDGFFANDEAHQLQLIRYIRRYQPEIILANALEDRHPDHGRAGKLIADACFLSGLKKITTHWEDRRQEAWRPKRIFHYIQDRLHRPDIIVDISNSFEEKMNAISCYTTQFFPDAAGKNNTYISQAGFLEKIKYRAFQLGQRIGTTYGEGYTCSFDIGIADMDYLIYPEFP